MAAIDRIWLGTVQLGMRYGLAEAAMSEAEAFRILDRAWDLGIRRFDTARVYGGAEDRLRGWLARSGHNPELCSKVPDLSGVKGDAGRAVRDSIDESLRSLGVERIDFMLCHNASDFSSPAVRDALRAEVESGRIGGYGISGYAPEEAGAALDLDDRLALVQLPGSVADRRLERSDVPARLTAAGSRLMVRSLLLQGVLLLPPNRLPAHVAAVRPFAEALGAGGLAAAVGHVMARVPGAEPVLGFLSAAELDTLEDLPETPQALDLPAEDPPLSAIDPRTWPKRG